MHHAAERRKARGGSLVEAMVALSVLAVGLVGVASALLAATRLDRRHSGRAAAHAVAMDLARTIERWDFHDPRLEVVNDYAGAGFASPTVSSFSLTPGSPPTLTETLSPQPDHDEDACGFCGRDLALAHLEEPGRTFLFRRYWNVVLDPNNAHLKLVAVHVTYSQSSSTRGVVTVYTSVFDEGALLRTALGAR